MDAEATTRLLAPSADALASVKVFPLIPALKKDVTVTIDSPLTWDQLTASDVNFAVVRPLVFKYARIKNMAIVYACLVVRSYFQRQAHLAFHKLLLMADMAFAGVNASRANLCEILAMKLLGYFASNYIQLTAVLTTSWSPLAGASNTIVEEVRAVLGGGEDVINYPQSALEMAISTRAKEFLSSPVTQRIVNDIYSGHVVFSMTGTRSVLADNYKPRPIEIYDCRNAPFLDHYRLRVPKYGAILEFLNFAVLLFTFVLCLADENWDHTTSVEWLFIVVATAFTLEEYTASTEHGWIIYMSNVWNVFDTSFIAIFFTYGFLRIRGLAYNDQQSSELAFDILSTGACILFPRLAFFAVSNTVVVLSLRAMMAEFIFFIGIASICFSGILFTLWTLGMFHYRCKATWTMKHIAWLMVQIWFGNTYLSFAQAESFHRVLGPILMTIFAALSNTLLLTILISILSNTVARIDANATQEHLFQFAISTIEGVKADALFSYQPPFNLLAFIILKPCSWVVSPRRLHSLNVLLIKITSFPILVIIGIYERHWAHGQALRETSKGAAQQLYHSLPRHIKHIPFVEALLGSKSEDLFDAIFDVELEHEDDLGGLEPVDESFQPLRSFHSRDNMRRAASPTPRLRTTNASPLGSPRKRVQSSTTNLQIEPASAAEIMPSTSRSPLAKLFTKSNNGTELPNSSMEASVRKIENLMDDIKDLPVHRLNAEMKELQDRQARIETLLLTLTRGMRNDTPMSPGGTQRS
ncbi:receptor-activated Ca2+-permeable cation channel [Mycena floridula]|nr:receptor-activated Ca2+-permeable cation channel [Mycena floridula]